MEKAEIERIIEERRRIYMSGVTLSPSRRRRLLCVLYEYITEHEGEIASALYSDLGKCAEESYMCEIGMVLSEISYMKKHLRSLTRAHRVRTPIAQLAARSYEIASPYGVVLIMSPWNYPFLLTLGPLVNAIAAGNCAVVKPSAYSPATSSLLERLISDCFPEGEVAAVTGGRAENTALLSCKFDMIFFTGSAAVGKEVLRRAAENLTPAVLELGGKSPCIVDKTARLPLAARRIVFGKLLNAGQTCVAPDYIICHESVRDELVGHIVSEIKRQCACDPLSSDDYGRIVSERHFDRLLSLIEREKLVTGGGYDRSRLKIEPAVMAGVEWTDPIMCEEIFGPLLPVLTYRTEEELISTLAQREKPLAMYIFTEDKRLARTLRDRLPFGGGCINDTVIHLATSEMGFGGVGESGMGSYHGRRGFEAFSNMKSIVDKKCFIDLPMRYRPYGKPINKWLIRKFLK